MWRAHVVLEMFGIKLLFVTSTGKFCEIACLIAGVDYVQMCFNYMILSRMS